MPATLSIMGLYNYDNTIFDLLQLPPGVDKNTLISNLVAELAENEALYPNTIVMKSLIGVWSAKRIKSWEKMFATTNFEYDPISNYDRKEEWSDNRSTTNRSSGSASNTTKNTNEQTNKVAGFNSENLVNESSNNNNGTTEITGSGSNENNGTENATHTGRTHGNIGVTTTQKMIAEERGISEFDIYSFIISEFKTRFCLMVY